jgi:DNA-binding response OmpR family regulator
MARVLIIDDDEDFASAMAMALRAAGHETDMEHEAQNAISHVERKPPDLIVLDVMFPEDSSAGFEVARTLRKRDDEASKIPIIMLTAVNAKFPLGFDSRDIDQQWLPVDDFLEKPVDFDVLLSRVAALLDAGN